MAYVSPFEDELTADAGQLQEASGANDNVISRSLRGGVLGARSQLASLGDAAAELAGFDEASRSLRATSGRLRDQAALPGNSPRVGSFEQLRADPTLDNALEYTGGLIGGSLPITAAGIAGGMATGGAGLVPAMLGAAGAVTPFNVGEVVQRQQADPEAMQQSAGQRASDALLGGGARSLVESVVPGIVGRQVLGKGLGGLARESAKQTVGRNALDIPMEGLTEGAGTAISQYAANQDKALDWKEIGEGAIGGAVAGTAFSGVGTAADLLHGAAPSAGETLKSARTSINERLKAAREGKADESAPAAPEPKIKSVWDDVVDLAQRGRTKVDDTVDRVLNGEELGVDPAEWARATTDEAKRRLTELSDNERVKAVKAWVDEMGVADTVGDLKDRAVQMTVAGMKKAWDGAKAGKAKVDGFTSKVQEAYNDYKRRDVDVESRDVSNALPAPKKSEDYSGAVEAVRKALDAAGLLQRRPDLFADDESINKMADSLRMLAEQAVAGKMGQRTVDVMVDTFGDDAVHVINTVTRSLAGANLDPAKTDKMFQSINRINQAQKQRSGLQKFLTEAMSDESFKTGLADGYLPELADKLVAHARGELTKKSTPAEAQAINTMMADLLEFHFGDKADMVSKRIEQEAKQYNAPNMEKGGGADFDEETAIDENGKEIEPSEDGFDEAGNRLDSATKDITRFGLSKPNVSGHQRSVVNGTAMHKDSQYVARDIASLKDKYSTKDDKGTVVRTAEQNGYDIRFDPLEGSEHGYVVVEDRRNPGEFNADELDRMKLEAKQYSGSKSRVEVGKKADGKPLHIIDAVKVARTMRNKMQDKFDSGAPTTAKQRLIDGFKQGMAQLTLQFNQKIDVPDSTVIGHIGKKPLTWGEAKKLDVRTDDDKLRDSNAREQEKLRVLYKEAKAKGADEKVLEKLKDAYIKLTDEHAEVLDGELSKGDDYQTASRERAPQRRNLAIDEVGPRLKTDKAEGATRYDNGQTKDSTGPMKPDKDGNIHAAGKMKEGDLIHRSNMDGSGQWVGSKGVEGLTPLVETLNTLWRGTPGETAKRIVMRTNALIKSAASMSAKDVRLLASLSEKSVGDAAQTVNDLARKYKDVIVTPTDGARGKANVAADGGAGGKNTFTVLPKTYGENLDQKEMFPLHPQAGSKPAAAKAKPNILANTIAKRQAYLNDPPADYTPADGESIKSWAEGQLKRVLEQQKAEKDASQDRQDQLSDYKLALMTLIKKAESVTAGDKSLAKLEGASKPQAEGLAGLMRLMADTNRGFGYKKEDIAARGKAIFGRKPWDDKATKISISGAGATLTARTSTGWKIVADHLRGDLPHKTPDGQLLVSRGATVYVTKTYDENGLLVHHTEGPITGFTNIPLDKAFANRVSDRYVDNTLEPYREEYLAFSMAGDALKKFSEGSPDPKPQAAKTAAAGKSGNTKYSLEGVNSNPQIHTDAFKEWYGDWTRHTDGVSGQDGGRNDGGRDPGGVPAAGPDAAASFLGGTGPTGPDGQPFVYYHGSRDDISYFARQHGRQKDTGWLGRGVYLTSDPDLAHDYARVKRRADGTDTGIADQNVMPLYAAVKNPYFATYEEKVALSKLGEAGAKAFTKRLKSQGYDGVVLNFLDGRQELVAFEPGDVKSAIGNNGEFNGNDPDVRHSAESTDPVRNNAKTYTSQDIKDHIEKVLGKSVRLAWATFTHAGEFTRMKTGDIIRLSVHALDPMSTAHHESLHAFFAQLRDAGAKDITDVLMKAASSTHVVAQLNERFKDQPAVLEQLKDAEERAAYMYQMWVADPEGFKVSIAARTTLQRIKAFVRKVLGAWSNDERALHIMNYLHEGQYARDMGRPSAVRQATMEVHRSALLDKARGLAEPIGRLADVVAGAGGDRMRNLDIPALVQLADLIKRDSTEEGGDQGYIQAARVEGTKLRNALGALLADVSEEHLHDAMEGLQSNTPATTPEGRIAARTIKKFLREVHGYMVKAGVNMGDLGDDYFPRVWDTHYISQNQQAFRDMLEPYIRSGKMKGSADELISRLTSYNGAELGIESRESTEPGMQHNKKRLLAFIKPEDAAQFVEKNIHATLTSYINQAARKAEWTRRLGGGKLEQLIADAKAQGATRADLKTAENYLKAVDGTLGDDLNPTARRLMGNMLVYQNIRLLPMAAFSMLVDPMGVVVNGGTVADAWGTFKRGMKGVTETFNKDGGEVSDQGTKWAELIGAVDTAMMTHVMGDIYSQGMVGGTAQKINSAFFKYNLVEGLNRNFRIGAVEAGVRFLARHAGEPSTHSKRWLRELGLRKGDIQLKADGVIALTEADGLTAEQVQRVHAALNQWVDGAVLRPDAADKPLWMSDPHWALVAHLKQFVFTFQKVILGRTMHEFYNGNYVPMMALASYVPIMVAADTAKGLLQGGGDTPEWKKGWGVADYMGYGVQRAGLLGVGQFGTDTLEDMNRGGSGIMALVGPTAEQTVDVLKTLGGSRGVGSTVLDALPANALYKNMVRDGPKDEAE